MQRVGLSNRCANQLAKTLTLWFFLFSSQTPWCLASPPTDVGAAPAPPASITQPVSTAPPASTAPLADAEAIAKYRALTRQILLAAIELERFSLYYRLYGNKRSTLVSLQYIGTQEAGAVGSLAQNLTIIKQSGKARHDPETFNPRPVKGGARVAIATSIVAAAGSAVALTYNQLVALRNARKKYDSPHAAKFVKTKLAAIDQLLAERDALVSAHHDHPLAPLAEEEGRILHLMRSAFVLEFATFLHDVRRIRVDENVFYALNTAANILSAVSAWYVIKAQDNLRFNAHANIIYTIYGGIATVSPIISTTLGVRLGRYDRNKFARDIGGLPSSPVADLATETVRLQEMIANYSTSGQQLPQGVIRAAMYTKSSSNFTQALEREARIMKYLNSVATQNDIVGPAIGGTALCQGILGTYGHYNYRDNDKKRANYDYAGAVVGTAGNATAIGVTAAALVFDLWYMRHLAKKGQLPEQLIQQRLEGLEANQKMIESM